MPFIETISEDSATGETAAFYGRNRYDDGVLPNFIRGFGYRPRYLEAFDALLDEIKANMDLRRYEIATIGAALALRNSYCMLAHGTRLMGMGMTAEALEALATAGYGDGISAEESAIFDFAQKVARDATAITQADVDLLRAQGLSDAEVFDVTAAAASRCVISKINDSMGIEPDSRYRELAPSLVAALTVGRPIAD